LIALKQIVKQFLIIFALSIHLLGKNQNNKNKMMMVIIIIVKKNQEVLIKIKRTKMMMIKKRIMAKRAPSIRF